jgi:hypothetical protein
VDTPGPLTIKRPKSPSILEQVFVIPLIVGPLIGLWYAWQHHLNIHLEQPLWNLALHAGLLVIPILWVVVISHKPFEFEQTGEELLCRSSFWDKLPMDWWTMLILWAPLLFAALSLGHDFFTFYLPNAADLSTTPLNAVAIMGVTLILGLFYAAGFWGNPERYTWISDPGLRVSLMRFFEWQDIHRVVRQGSRYLICHRSNPGLPTVGFNLRDNASQAKFESYLARHQVPVSNTTDRIFALVKAIVVLGFLLIMLFALWLRLTTELSLLWITLIVFGIATALTLGFERFRGISRQKKYWPRNQRTVAPELDSGTGPTQ